LAPSANGFPKVAKAQPWAGISETLSALNSNCTSTRTTGVLTTAIVVL